MVSRDKTIGRIKNDGKKNLKFKYSRKIDILCASSSSDDLVNFTPIEKHCIKSKKKVIKSSLKCSEIDLLCLNTEKKNPSMSKAKNRVVHKKKAGSCKPSTIEKENVDILCKKNTKNSNVDSKCVVQDKVKKPAVRNRHLKQASNSSYKTVSSNIAEDDLLTNKKVSTVRTNQIKDTAVAARGSKRNACDDLDGAKPSKRFRGTLNSGLKLREREKMCPPQQDCLTSKNAKKKIECIKSHLSTLKSGHNNRRNRSLGKKPKNMKRSVKKDVILSKNQELEKQVKVDTTNSILITSDHISNKDILTLMNASLKKQLTNLKSPLRKSIRLQESSINNYNEKNKNMVENQEANANKSMSKTNTTKNSNNKNTFGNPNTNTPANLEDKNQCSPLLRKSKRSVPQIFTSTPFPTQKNAMLQNGLSHISIELNASIDKSISKGRFKSKPSGTQDSSVSGHAVQREIKSNGKNKNVKKSFEKATDAKSHLKRFNIKDCKVLLKKLTPRKCNRLSDCQKKSVVTNNIRQQNKICKSQSKERKKINLPNSKRKMTKTKIDSKELKIKNRKSLAKKIHENDSSSIKNSHSNCNKTPQNKTSGKKRRNIGIDDLMTTPHAGNKINSNFRHSSLISSISRKEAYDVLTFNKGKKSSSKEKGKRLNLSKAKPPKSLDLPPRKGTLKRARWIKNKLDEKNDGYEDDFLDNQNFDVLKKLLEMDDNYELPGISTPNYKAHFTPAPPKGSPRFKDCISHTDLVMARKNAEEYIHRRKNLKRYVIPDIESAGTCEVINDKRERQDMPEKRKLDFKEALKSVEEIQKRFSKCNEEDESDQDHYLSDDTL